MIEPVENYPNFEFVCETSQLLQKLNELKECTKNIDTRVFSLGIAIDKRLLILEDEILKFYRDKEKSFYDRMGDDIHIRIHDIEETLKIVAKNASSRLQDLQEENISRIKVDFSYNKRIDDIDDRVSSIEKKIENLVVYLESLIKEKPKC